MRFLGYILNHIKRSAVTSVLFCLLLALAGTLLSVTAGLWYSAFDAVANIDERIITIAIPDTFAINTYAKNFVTNSGMTEFDAGSGVISLRPASDVLPAGAGFDASSSAAQTALETAQFIELAAGHIAGGIMRDIRETLYGAGILHMDHRRVFNAYSPGISSVPVRAFGITHTVFVANSSPQSTAAFIGKCEAVSEHLGYAIKEGPDGSAVPYLSRYFHGSFTVEKPLYLHSAYDAPKTLEINFTILDPGCAPPVEEGKRYVLVGHNYDPMAKSNYPEYFPESDMNIWVPGAATLDTVERVATSEDDLMPVFAVLLGRNYGVEDEDYPLEIVSTAFESAPDTGGGGYSAFELTGSLEDALASPGSERLKEALSAAEISYNSFQVLTTNNMGSLFRFHQLGKSTAIGRAFTAKEAAQGARVCLISGQFAEENGLSVGDRLPICIYPAELTQTTITAAAGEDAGPVDRTYYIPDAYEPGTEVSGPLDFEIIGIYEALTLQSGNYSISNNFVIIPDKSFDGVGAPMQEVYASSGVPPLLADAVIVPNGGIEQAKAAINSVADGYGEFFRFYDQGYTGILSALLNLRMGTTWIFAFAAVGWLAVILLFLLFFITRKRREATLLHAVGVSVKNRFRWIFIQCALLIFLAQGAALSASLPLYGGILNNAASAAESFTGSFRDYTLSDGQEAGIRSSMPIMEIPLAVIAAAACETALLLGAAGVVTRKAVVFKSLDAGREGG